MGSAVGKVIGGVVLVGATAAVWLLPEPGRQEAAAPVVRPVRSVVVAEGGVSPDMTFAGIVKASESRTLTFKQSGRIERMPVSKGQKVKKGDKLAWLDPADFRQRLAQAEAAVNRDRTSFKRKSEAARKNAISQEEVSHAEAMLKQSEAAYELAKRALDETVLLAPFDGTIAATIADELDMVSGSSQILRIQDMSKVKVDVTLPESLVIRAKNIAYRDECSVTEIYFDSYPQKRYPARFLDNTAAADAKTQTFVATYEMAVPEDLTPLPGMSATLVVRGDKYCFKDVLAAKGVTVPESAVAVDATGGHFVWKLVETAEKGVFETHKTAVKLGQTSGSSVFVVEGLVKNERVATAGVSLLVEGQKVRLAGE